MLKPIDDKLYMTQDERWMARYEEVMGFLEENHRNPSKHRIEEHLMLNFIKHNRKLMNAGTMKPDRVERFNNLLALIEDNKRLNQYAKPRVGKKRRAA